MMDTSHLDKQSLILLHRTLGTKVKESHMGVLEGDLEAQRPWSIAYDSSHHLGGTRMGNDPTTSVVNSDLRIHNVLNTYVCSGSVFPTSGCANPTYTICALAIRLADTLKTNLEKN